MIESYEKILTKPKKLLLQKLVFILQKIVLQKLVMTKECSIYFIDKKDVVEQGEGGSGHITTIHLLTTHSTYYYPKSFSK